MPPHTCAYFNCKNNSSMKPMFSFPWTDRRRLAVWLENCGNMTITHLPPENLRKRYLCRDHFNVNYLRNKNGRRRRLCKTAIPDHYKAPVLRSPSPVPGLETHQLQHSDKGCELLDATSGGRDLKDKSSRPDTLRTTTPELGTIELPQGNVIISRVYHYLEKEYETLKSSIGHSCDLSFLENILKRTAEATGVNERTVTAVLQGNTFLEDVVLPEESALRPVPSKRAKLELECENDDNRSECAEPHCTTDQTLRLIKSEPSEADEQIMSECAEPHCTTDQTDRLIKSEPSEADEQIMCTDSTVQFTEVLAEPLINIHRTYRGPRTIQDPLKLDALNTTCCTVPYADNKARFAPPLVKSEPLEHTLPAPD